MGAVLCDPCGFGWSHRAVTAVGVNLSSGLGSVSDLPSDLASVLDLGLDCAFATLAKAGGTFTTCGKKLKEDTISACAKGDYCFDG